MVRSIPKGPFGYSFTYFPVNLGKLISPDELSETTEILTFIEEKLRTKAHWAHQIINVGVADEKLAKNLSVGVNTPLLVIERDFYSESGSVMWASITHYRCDIYKYEMKLTRT